MSAPRSMTLHVAIEKRPMKAPFHITGYTFTGFDALVLTLREGGSVGRGEAQGVYYKHDNPPEMLTQIEALRHRIERGITRGELLECLPPGGARNALDAALWDLESSRRGIPAWQLAGIDSLRPLRTTFTIGADDPARMAERARGFPDARALKLKLTDDDCNAERVRAVRAARPDVWIMVDANQGLTRASLARLLPTLQQCRVSLIEQPFPIGNESWLDGVERPIPIAADESVQDHTDLARLAGRVDIINIKLDKCGGLTEALSMASQARAMGFDLMVGNMSGSSLAMAPAFVLGQQCAVVDLDGPLYLCEDWSPGAIYQDGTIWCPGDLWGGGLPAAA